MLKKLVLTVASIATLLSIAAAQQPVWSQCGGIGWTGATTCIAGLTCEVLNPYYSQCIPGTASTTPSQPTTTTSLPTTTSAGGSTPTSGVKPNFWFSFGDSYTQTGFEIDGTVPSIGNPLGNPPYPGFTAVGGTNWIDLNTVANNNSLLLTWNYAYGGATIDASLVQPYDPTVLSLTDQVNEFLGGAASKPSNAPWTGEDALFSFWIGINDIGNSYYLSGDRDAFSDTLLDAYFALVQKIVKRIYSDAGGRNFLFINVPPVDRSPLMLAQAASAQAAEKAVILGFNAKLATRASDFRSQNSGVQTWVWDSNAEFNMILDDPTAYGFVDNTSFGGTGDFWGNNYHPSSAAHTIFSKQIAELLGDTIW